MEKEGPTRSDDAASPPPPRDTVPLRGAWQRAAGTTLKRDSDDIFAEPGFGGEAGLPPYMREMLQARVSLGSVSEETIVKVGAAPQAPQGDFEYGWCYTDHKTGKEIRKDWRTADYLNDEPYATRVHAMLDQLGLPAPRKEEIFRGTNHDLLFLNSHGVVIRIGPHDVEDLFNPGILQPLGWIEDRETAIAAGGAQLPLTVAIYPGVELESQYLEAKRKPGIVGNLYQLMSSTQQGLGDVHTEGNTGIIRVMDDNGEEVAVRVLVDADNRFNGSSQKMREKRTSYIQSQSSSASSSHAPVGKSDLMRNTLSSIFNAARDVRYWEKAYEVHEPLRKLFWDTFGNVKAVAGVVEDTAQRKLFWDTCAAVTNKPVEMTLPVWRIKTSPDGQPSFERQEIHVPHLVLYRPWTGKDADQVIQPIRQAKGLREAVHAAHAAEGFDQKFDKFRQQADKNLGQRLLSLGRRMLQGVKAPF